MMTPEALALATAHAARDEATLARLVATGKVVRAATHQSAERKFAAMGKPQINLAIRAKRKKGKR